LAVGVDEAKAITVIGKNPEMKSALVKIGEAIKTLPQKLTTMSESLAKHFPKGSSFVRSILGKLGDALKGLYDFIKKVTVTVTGGTGTLGKATRGALSGGIPAYYSDTKQETQKKKALAKIFGADVNNKTEMSDDEFEAQLNAG
jgi:hypothetical protein